MKNLKVLLVEDDPLSRLLLHSTLQSLGYDVVCLENGLDAWNYIKEKEIRLVVSDWQIPGLDGLELCARIRSKVEDYVYFILVTNSYLNEESETIAIDAGVDDFMPKPVKIEDLRNRLRVASRFLGHMERIRKLESFIPLCSYCRKVRDDQNYWKQIETYIKERTGSQFSHAVCPDCYQEHVRPQLAVHETNSCRKKD